MFAGLGGFRSGLTRLGDFFMPVGWCEIDRYAQRAYQSLYETKEEYFCDDARNINTAEMPDIDLLCAGFPCQPFSQAGQRRGFTDTRGTLFFEIARILADKTPSFFILENVPGLLSHDKGATFKVIISALADLGYSLEWCVLNSKNFGVPQQRKRLYIVGYIDDRYTGKVFPIRGGNAENLKQLVGGCQGQRVYLTDGVASTMCSGSGGWGGKTGLYFIDMNSNPQITDHARCITSRQDSGISKRKGEHSGVLIEQNQHFIDLNPDPKITDESRCLHTRMDLEVVGTHKGDRSGVLVEEAPRAILTPHKENTRQNGRRMKEPDEEMFTITATDRHGICHRGKIRRLMPIECFRLQGYTDEQFNKLVEIGIPDTQLYKMAGNSVTVHVISAIGNKLKQVMEELSI